MPKRVVLALAISIARATSSEGQTFVQLTDLGSNIGPRLTRSVSRARVDRTLFSHIGTKVTFIEGTNAYEFATDFGRVWCARPRAGWSSGSTGFTVEGTNRLTAGAALRLQSIGVPLTLATEYDRDEGSVPADWVRATAGVSLWQTRVQALVGLSDDVRTNGSPRTSECGLLVRVDRLLFGLGARFSSASDIGTTFVFSLTLAGTAPRAVARQLAAGNQILP